MNSLIPSQRLGLAILGSLFLFVVIEILFIGADPAKQNLDAIFTAPSLAEPLGTDQFGRSNIASFLARSKHRYSWRYFVLLRLQRWVCY
ncbi:hypothetical protein JCM19233_7485 [Vibrio astriarenae]|nr:hypothetical protein JCM19233_7485 [Vibrio sp. C7]